MSIRKRIEGSREERAKARAKRREEARRAERAKLAAKAEGRKERTGKARAAKGGKEPVAKLEKRRDTKAEKRPEAKAAKPRRRRAPRTASADIKRVVGKAGGVGAELLKLAREMVMIPVGLWLAAAEIAGGWVLKAWRRALRPALVAVWRFGVAAVRLAERVVTPARAVAAVAVVAIAALVASQWQDYHSVSVGIDAYAGEVGTIAPAPEVESEIAGNAHGWVMVPLAALALVAVGVALLGRRRAAVLLVPIGLAVLAISLIVDMPKGLDEGTAAVAYDSAEASLLEGFWLQLAAGVVLVACGVLLSRYLRPQRELAPLTGPSLFDRGARAARKLAERRPTVRKPKLNLPRRPRPKRKVQGART